MDYLDKYQSIRRHTIDLCQPLKTEDYVVQPGDEVSPPKWHLGHTTWFFETLILKPNKVGYREFNPHFNFIFNSYYESAGERMLRANRGSLSRPTVTEIMLYRAYVDKSMEDFLARPINKDIAETLIIGLNHEQQHQELMLMDIKYIFGHNPLFPVYHEGIDDFELTEESMQAKSVIIPEGQYEIGYAGESFCYDNERERHQVFLEKFSIDSELVSNKDYLRFIEKGGYQDFHFWHSEGWEWVKKNNIKHPLYWYKIGEEWQEYTLSGLQPLSMNRPLCNISYYEAAAYAEWAGKRLPTEAEWEVASDHFDWGKRWEWTGSAYLPYPRYQKPKGTLGEYNAKFMVNQMVLRGACEATPTGHSRKTYRNFFHAGERWQLSGIRLAKTLID